MVRKNFEISLFLDNKYPLKCYDLTCLTRDNKVGYKFVILLFRIFTFYLIENTITKPRKIFAGKRKCYCLK